MLSASQPAAARACKTTQYTSARRSRTVAQHALALAPSADSGVGCRRRCRRRDKRLHLSRGRRRGLGTVQASVLVLRAHQRHEATRWFCVCLVVVVVVVVPARSEGGAESVRWRVLRCGGSGTAHSAALAQRAGNDANLKKRAMTKKKTLHSKPFAVQATVRIGHVWPELDKKRDARFVQTPTRRKT